MKVEEAKGTEMPLETIPCTDNTMIQTSSPINPKWCPQDDTCAKLFGPWDNLPCYDHINEVRLLRDLDNTIVLFEEQINHSDAGFRVWQNRHKQAMEAGLVEVPGFPCLQSVHKGKRAWHDEAWEQRYFYLVYQRREIIMGRLSRLLALPRYAQEDFFGQRPALPRMMMQHGKGRYTRPLLLRCDWWRSVDDLLKAAAERWKMDEAELKTRFWADDCGSGVKTQAQEWDGVIKQEDSVELYNQDDGFDPPEFAANWVSEAWWLTHSRRTL